MEIKSVDVYDLTSIYSTTSRPFARPSSGKIAEGYQSL